MAEAGMGIAETLCETAPSVCCSNVRISLETKTEVTSYLAWSAHGEEAGFLRHGDVDGFGGGVELKVGYRASKITIRCKQRHGKIATSESGNAKPHSDGPRLRCG